MPGVILELNRIARDTGIRFDSITPQAPADSGGYQGVPINLVFQGNYFELSDFLFRVRNLVCVRGRPARRHRTAVRGRSLCFSEGVKKFPQIQATLGVAAFVYGTGGAPPARAAAPPRRAARPPPAARRAPTRLRPPPAAAGRDRRGATLMAQPLDPKAKASARRSSPPSAP